MSVKQHLCAPQQQQTEVVQELEYQISLLNNDKQSLAEQIRKLQRCVPECMFVLIMCLYYIKVIQCERKNKTLPRLVLCVYIFTVGQLWC